VPPPPLVVVVVVVGLVLLLVVVLEVVELLPVDAGAAAVELVSLLELPQPAMSPAIATVPTAR
jgi:hypothetical protein